jgi:cytochrome c peroxidase
VQCTAVELTLAAAPREGMRVDGSGICARLRPVKGAYGEWRLVREYLDLSNLDEYEGIRLMHTALSKRYKVGVGLFLVLALVSTLLSPPAMAAPGGTLQNGSNTDPQVAPPLFLFEPEFPLNSLKTVPIWDELEQLLDNPYRSVLCSAVPGTVDALVRNTPGTTQITGSPPAPTYPAYCSTIIRRPGFGVQLPPLLLHPLNYNPTTGEEMRLLNPGYPGGAWTVPDELIQCSSTDRDDLPAQCDGTITVNDSTGAPVTTGPFDPNRWVWKYRPIEVSSGERVEAAAIDYNAPIKPDPFTCMVTTEVVPPEGSTICGGDPGEPNYGGFGVNRADGYSTPAVPGVASPGTAITTQRLFDPTRGAILPRNASGAGGLRKPSLRVPPYGTPSAPGYDVNVEADAVAPSNENDYVRDRQLAAVLGKSLFWDMQVGSDTVQACGSCHAHAGADNRTKNQLNPNHLGGDLSFEVRQPNEDLVRSDFPFHKLLNPDVAGDPKCTTPIVASINAGVLENNLPNGGSVTVCSAANAIPNKNNANGTKVANDVASSMGVHFGAFYDIPTPSLLTAFNAPSNGVASLKPDLRSPNVADNFDPIPGFQGTDGSGHGIRRVEPRNTPTIFAAALNFDNFWDGRARHDFNGGSVFGASDPQKHVFVSPTGGPLTQTRQIIRFASLASLATGPALSEFEMSFLGRNWAKIGKKLLQVGVTPLANQLVATTDSVLGPYSNQGGAACGGLPSSDRSAGFIAGGTAVGKPGLCINYPALIRRTFYAALWSGSGVVQNGSQTTQATQHLNGCYTQGGSTTDPLRPVCPDGTGLAVGLPTDDDPFDHYILTLAQDPANPLNTNQFTQMEGNFSLFFGLSLQIWVSILMPDNTPFDQFLDRNPDMFESIGEVGEPGLVGPLPTCTSATQRHCFREVGNFKRDNNLDCNNQPAGGEGGGTVAITPCRGTRVANSNTPDPLLGMDIFQGSNLSLKNPNFRAARCGECHAGGTLTDNTVPFTFKAQLGDFIGEFLTPGNEALVEPLGRTRVITGFLLESELNENGQDAVERRMINQSIAPCPTDGFAYPGGLEPGSGQGFGRCSGAAQAFFDNGVYNLGVTRCEANHTGVVLGGYCDDVGRGGTDAFGWPLSLAALLLKNLGGNAGAPCADPLHCSTEPGSPLVTFDPALGGGGGLFEETAQDQEINPGEEGEPVRPLLPPYLAPWASQINVGDAQPELDEVDGGLNTLTDVAMLEGFIDILGPFNPAGVLNEAMNNGVGPQMGTWPDVNRVGRMGSFKAPQLREVELTGPYFHNGGKLTLRQVVDFYTRGGDFPLTNAQHRDFNIVNMNVEVQSNLSEAEKVALVDFLLELTDDRVRFERGPFDHPQVILPLDGRAPENTGGRTGTFGLAGACVASLLGPGHRACANGMFLDVPAVGTAGSAAPLPNFLGIASGPRLVGGAANCGPAANNHYCR